MKLIPIFAVIALTAASAVQAQAAHRDPTWQLIDWNNDTTLLIDRTNMKRTGNIVSVSELLLTGQDHISFHRMVDSLIEKDPAKRAGQWATTAFVVNAAIAALESTIALRHVEYDCATNRYQYVDDGAWHEIPPASMGAEAKKYVCKKD
jgi:hypothetical protein